VLGLEALVDSEPEDERVAGRQAAAHLVLVPQNPAVAGQPVVKRVLVARGRGLFTIPGPGGELPAVGGRGSVVVRPLVLGTHALRRYALHPVADLGARVIRDMAFHGPFVVIDEQARGHEIGQALFLEIELESAADGVRGAAADPALVVHGRALAAQIGAGRQGRDRDLWCREQMVSGVRQVRHPAVAGRSACPGRWSLCCHRRVPSWWPVCSPPEAGSGQPCERSRLGPCDTSPAGSEQAAAPLIHSTAGPFLSWLSARHAQPTVSYCRPDLLRHEQDGALTR